MVHIAQHIITAILYFSQKQPPGNIARALYDSYARLLFAQQLFLREDYLVVRDIMVHIAQHITTSFDFEARVLIGWLAILFACQPIRTHTSESKFCVFMLRWPTFLMSSIFLPIIQAFRRPCFLFPTKL